MRVWEDRLDDYYFHLDFIRYCIKFVTIWTQYAHLKSKNRPIFSNSADEKFVTQLPFQDRFLVANTPESILLGDLQTCQDARCVWVAFCLYFVCKKSMQFGGNKSILKMASFLTHFLAKLEVDSQRFHGTREVKKHGEVHGMGKDFLGMSIWS